MIGLLSNQGEWLAKQIAEALEVRAAQYDALSQPHAADVRRSRADELRKVAKLLRTNELPGVDWEDHL